VVSKADFTVTVTTSIKLVRPAVVTTSIKLHSNLL
jgi:hypothetical protein